MQETVNRRQFLTTAGLSAMALATGTTRLFAQSAHPEKLGLKIAYSAITWGNTDAQTLQAIQDLSALGYKGIQLRANVFGTYRAKPSELKALLDKNRLTLAMFSSGNVEIDPAKEQSTIDMHVAHASFVKALGGSAFQMTNTLRPKDRQPTTEELKRLAAVMNEIGKQTADMGVQATYHNHMHQLGETPEEVDVIVQAMNPKYCKLLLDIAHYKQGGGQPEKAVKQYKDIIHALHLKDTLSPRPDKPDDPKAYKFVELGRGNVDVPAVFKALDEINFKGWGVIELDGVPETDKTPAQCASINKEYITKTLHYPL
ncbi:MULTISPECIES: sugar phosphate isomerase/epimerase family protein [Spirosoma]|uniref:Sugar phosphate isomerase/epimerase n=1 Tax=Spirosoma liriopis TaxID=2937440 RepID=A0ABT0HLY3_9BACT|nr:MULTISPECIES: sugar phosphate isomerase/epimerase [Spirosoma]MCK8492970.1 sugar phosphate isomerase/epimerase [Spirosoma liriopis]UHG92370.1 sugar phosphate isomerase/epimerase [Spirosoma oryzicola]